MANIISVRDFTPQWGKSCFIAETATLIGQLNMGDYCSVWFNAVVRADVNAITVGHHSNIQDGAVIHCTYEKAATHIGNYVTIGHRAIVHGCTLEDKVMVGMGAIVMDHAVVESGAMIAAGAVVLENTRVEANSIYAGVPAKKVKAIGPENRAMMERIANNYTKYAEWYK
ncbi:gamma carbonic anhydrase family protein [Porifericola rhodea]|uniref:gamma carbonic anhydrase family protein n=1 Tax=Porifericola rhodea TaxID=930972 RepID=UPI00266541AE|nr:gamma carbonic anhydrase family protein [Porifericola rhodea]WKN32158.1 gamma carbonic anhydrase family protein [Porifericola rhodea]